MSRPHVTAFGERAFLDKPNIAAPPSMQGDRKTCLERLSEGHTVLRGDRDLTHLPAHSDFPPTAERRVLIQDIQDGGSCCAFGISFCTPKVKDFRLRPIAFGPAELPRYQVGAA